MGYVLLALGMVIIVGLTSYAILLHLKLNKATQEQQLQEQQAEQTLRHHQQQLVNDIRFVARAMLAEQCEITEGVLRLHHLISTLDADVWQHASLPTLRLHHQQTCDMPILEAYQALSKQQQFALDNERYELEHGNKEALMLELEWLVGYRFPSVLLLNS